MKRHLHIIRLLALLGGLVVFSLATHFLHGYQVKRQAGSLIKQADLAEEKKAYQVALGHLRSYLGFQPGDTDVLARYGRLLARKDVATTPRARNMAISILESVLRRDPTRDEERRLLIDLCIQVRDHKTAQEHLESLLGLKKDQNRQQQLERILKEDPKKGELVGKLATCHLAGRNYQEAREFYELAVRNVPGEASNYVGLARLLREHTDEVLRTAKDRKTRETPRALHQQADQLFDTLVKANPGSFRAYLTRAEYRGRYPLPAGQIATFEAIERDLRQALKLAGDDADVLLALAKLEGDRNEPSRAREFLLRGRARHPRDWRMYQALSHLERGLNRSDEALSHLRQGLKELPEQLELLLEFADLLVATGSGEAGNALDELKGKGVPREALDILSSRLLIREREWAKAVERLVNAHALLVARDNVAGVPFAAGLVEQCNALMGQCYESLGDPYRAQHAYQRMLEGNRRSPAARLGMARTHAALGQVREAESQYRQLARLPNAQGSWVEIARLVLQRNLRLDNPDWDEVNETLKLAERLQPRPVAVALLRAEALAAQAEREADKEAKEKRKQEAREVLVVNLLGGMPIWTGEMLPVAALPQARALAALWVGLSALEERAGRPEAALQLLARAERHFGDLVELRQARTRYWARRRGPEAVKALAVLARGLDKFAPEERRQLRMTLALACTSVGQPEQASRLWQALAKDHPDDWAVRLVLFNQALEKKDEPAMDSLLEQLRDIEKEDGVLWRDATVRRLLAKAALGDPSGLPQARKLVGEIAAHWPGWVGVTQFEGQIEDLAGDPGKALPKYRAAIDKGGATVQVVWRAMEILNSQQRFREASALRAKLPGQGQFSAGLEQAAALASFRANDNAEALLRAERAVDQAPGDYRPRLLLGQIYWRMEQLDKALSSLERARELGDRAPETWLTLIGFLSSTDRKDRARAELVKAEKKLTDTRGRLALAQCYEFLGENDKTGKVFANPEVADSLELPVRRAVASYYLRTGNAKAAETHLNFLVRAARTQEPGTVVWARSMLAVLAALGGDYAKTKEALASLEQSGAGDTAAGIEGRRAQAVILATRGNRGDRIKAIGVLQAFIDEGRDQPHDRLLLASLYEANNDWPQARKQLAALLKMAGGNTAPNLVAYISALLRHGEPEEAEQALGQLEKIPSTAGTLPLVSLKAQVWHRQGKEKAAVALLTDHATKQGMGFGQVGVVLEELKEYKAAEQMYQKHAEKAQNPAALLAYAEFLGRRKRFDEALDICERAWAKVPPRPVANTCLGILEAASDNEAVQGRVERQFRAALKKDPQSVLLRLSLANLHILQRQYGEAESVYRDLIREGPGNIDARNNLSWLLACRKQRLPDALTLMEEAIGKAGPRSTLLDTQALVFLAADKTKEAVKLLEGIVVESPREAGFHFHLAQAHAADRNPQGAKKALLQAHRLGLKENTLHPLEQQGYAQLLRDLGIPRTGLAD